MDEDSKELLKAVAGAALAPVTKVLDNVIGLAGGDWLEHKRRMAKDRREKNTADTAERAKSLLEQRGVTPDPETATEHVEQILDAAADESDAEIRDLFARLLAAAMDPKRRTRFRRDYIQIVRQLEPLDALVFKNLAKTEQMAPTRLEFIAKAIDRHRDEIAVAFDKLDSLGLIAMRKEVPDPGRPFLSPMGRELTTLLDD